MAHPRKKRSAAQGRKRKPVAGSKAFVASRAMTGMRRLNGRKEAGIDLADDRFLTLEELESNHIRKVLQHVSDNKTRAAQILGINRVSLWRKIKSMGLPAPAVCPEEF